MSQVIVNVSDLKNVIGKLNLAVEKSKINPKQGWIEMEVSQNVMYVKVSNYDYYFESQLPVQGDCDLHATVTADTFIPLVSKLDSSVGSVELFERLNSLILSTSQSEYTFPIIKELGKVRSVDSVAFNEDGQNKFSMSGKDLCSIAEVNAKGLLDSIFSREIQQFIYVDNLGALTFTENIYINNFQKQGSEEFKFLLNCSQAKLVKVFDGHDDVDLFIETSPYEKNTHIKLSVADKLSLVLITQPMQMVDKFPSIKLRKLAQDVSETHAVVDKQQFEKALQRLMVFDKKFDITVLNYSKLVFGKESVKLVSIKNKNYEVVPYKSFSNTSEHESVIRFADIQNQLKAIQSKDIDISYGDSPAIVLNTVGLKQLIPEVISVEQ